MGAVKLGGCSPLSRIYRRHHIHQAFFVFATARRDLVHDESWVMTAREFKRRFNVDDVDEETLVRTCSESIRDFIADKTL